jgi:hypothetical protein
VSRESQPPLVGEEEVAAVAVEAVAAVAGLRHSQLTVARAELQNLAGSSKVDWPMTKSSPGRSTYVRRQIITFLVTINELKFDMNVS